VSGPWIWNFICKSEEKNLKNANFICKSEEKRRLVDTWNFTGTLQTLPFPCLKIENSEIIEVTTSEAHTSVTSKYIQLTIKQCGSVSSSGARYLWPGLLVYHLEK
jgi:hypothetical protein